MIGETVTHYRILEKVGEGGMGVVYRAEDKRLGRQVAVKFLSARLSNDPAALERFQREARAASSLNHPHICALYDIGRHDNVPFLVMELLDGATLRQRINGTPLAVAEVVEFGVEIADALDAAHTHGIVHRDIKSANIFVTSRGQVKMLDFGLAKLAQRSDVGVVDPFSDTTLVRPAAQATETGQTFGTLSYMSPEQARGEELDGRSDLFSFGVVLYEMATGHEPFKGKTSALIFDAILNEMPAAPSTVNPQVSPELDHIILKALEKDRDLRYQSAADLRTDLKRLQRASDSTRARTAVRSSAAAAAPPGDPGDLSVTRLGPAAPKPASGARVASGTRVTSGTRTRIDGPRGAGAPGVAGDVAGPADVTVAAVPSAVTESAVARSPRIPAAVIAIVALIVVAIAATGGWLYWRGSGTAVDSVAVLPFVAVTPASDTEYLTDGITETLINGLTQLPGLRVAARSVVFRYKGRDVDPQQIGRDLNVKAIVTGRVSARADRLIIRAELMNVETGAQLWGDWYDRPPSDLLAVQDEIAREILDRLRPRASGEDKKLATKRYTDDAEAYQLYLQGRYNWNKGTIAGYKSAIEYFQQAIQKDPRYALAYAGLADSYLLLGSYWVEAITEAKTAAEQALKIDANLAEAHVALGHIKLWLDWDWPAAQREFERGIALNQASALAHNQYAMYLSTVGRVSDAVAEVKRAQELDPLSPIVNSDLGTYLLYAGQIDEAMTQFRKTIDLDSNSVSAHRGLGIAASEAGRHDEAIAELKRALLLSENSPMVLGHLGAAYARQRNQTEADRVLKDLQALSAREYVPSSAIAIVYAAMGDRKTALDWLEKAYDEHDFSMAQITVAPWFRTLRGEDRFQKLVTKLGLPR